MHSRILWGPADGLRCVVSLVFSICTTSMKPAGKNMSVLTLLSTLISRCMTIILHSLYVRAYFSLLRSITMRGMHSRILWGPADGLGAHRPLSLSSIQCEGANMRFKCFFGPRAIVLRVSAGREQRQLEAPPCLNRSS